MKEVEEQKRTIPEISLGLPHALNALMHTHVKIQTHTFLKMGKEKKKHRLGEGSCNLSKLE